MSSSSPPITTAITVVTAPAPAATGPSELHTIIKHSADLSKMDTAPALNDAVPPQSGDGLQESTKQNVVEEDMVDATVEAEAENGNDDAQSEDAQPLTLEQAMACLHEGKRHLKCHEYAKAADCFSKVSETLYVLIVLIFLLRWLRHYISRDLILLLNACIGLRL